jgi:transcriptional regulator with XRE-family HTH domain
MTTDDRNGTELAALGKAIRALRVERGISLSDFDAAGVKPGVLDDLENGRLDPPFDLLLRVCRAMGVTPGIIVRRAESIGGES